MNLQNIDLSLTAGLPSQLIKSGNLPQVAFSGRSNVGKSSLINKLLKRKALARTSAQPGKTVTINYYNVDNSLFFVDLPGYGYAKRSESEKRKWSNLVDGYFNDNQDLKLVVQLIDLKVGITKDDAIMLDWLYETATPFIIVATKSDKLNATNRKANLQALIDHELVPDDVKVIPFSALNGENADEIREILFSAV